jgi:amino acid transporter
VVPPRDRVVVQAARLDSLSPAPTRPKATAFQLVFMTYAVICSGAYGLEEMVSSSGPGMAILTLAVLPFIWAAPLSLACSELSARFPVEGGYYRWARLAFGEFVGYLAGWLTWLAIFATNASFAVLFADYLRRFVPGLSDAGHFAAAAGLVWLTVYLNYRGIRLVGGAAVALTLLIFVPFLALTVMGVAQWKFDPFSPFVAPGKSAGGAFLQGLLIAIWLYSGFEKLTVNAEEVENPSRSFPIALAWAVPLVALSYIIPTAAALAAHNDWTEWGTAHFSAAAAAVGGPALGDAMAAGGLASNACLLLVTVLGQSRLPVVLAEDGLFPRAFRRVDRRFGSPVMSLLVGGVVLTALCVIPFAPLAGLFSMVQVMSYMLIYASLFRLRARPAAGAAGGFRIPVSRAGLVLMTAPSVALAVLVIYQSLLGSEGFGWKAAGLALAVFGSGPISYLFFRKKRRPAVGGLPVEGAPE